MPLPPEVIVGNALIGKEYGEKISNFFTGYDPPNWNERQRTQQAKDIPGTLNNPQGPGAHPDPTQISGSFFPAEQLYPLQTRDLKTQGDFEKEVLDQFNQLVPTSENLRNYNLSQILSEYDRPMEQLYAAQLNAPVAAGRRGNLDALRATMAARGLTDSGIADEGRLGIESAYLQGVGAAGQQARQQENQRRNMLLREILNVPADDIRFYEAIRSGAVPMGSLWNIDTQNWGQMAYGLGTMVRSLASMGAGAAAGGGSLGGGGGISYTGSVGGVDRKSVV